VFTLDSVVRSVGRYPFRTEQADRLDDRVTLDYERLFELSLDERTAAYLEVPRSATRGLIDWHLTADVVADPRYAPALPHVVAELAAVRSPPPTPITGRALHSRRCRSYVYRRAVHRSPYARPRGDSGPRLARGRVRRERHQLHARVAPARARVAARRRPLDVHVVYNDDSIDAPDEVPYDTHATEETNLQVSRSLSTAELRNALLAETDFLHFIGHVTERGMECSDGTLDVRTLPTTGVGAFFLNGCRSYEQGFALLTAGATGGIVTTDDIEDTVASTAGRHAAVLLGNGFPLYAVLDVFSHAGVGTERYTVLGDPTLQLRKPLTGSPVLYEFATDETADASDAVPLTSHSYPGKETGLASLLMSVHTADSHNLLSASATSTAMSFENLAEYLESVTMPTLLDDDLHLTDDLSVEDFRQITPEVVATAESLHATVVLLVALLVVLAVVVGFALLLVLVVGFLREFLDEVGAGVVRLHFRDFGADASRRQHPVDHHDEAAVGLPTDAGAALVHVVDSDDDLLAVHHGRGLQVRDGLAVVVTPLHPPRSP